MARKTGATTSRLTCSRGSTGLKKRHAWLESSEEEPPSIIEMFDNQLEVLHILTVQTGLAMEEELTGLSDFVQTIKKLVSSTEGIEAVK